MNLTPRLKQIFIVLLQENHVMAVKELAERIGVSKRTVQRELEYMGTDLKESGIRFESKTGKGVWLEGSQEDKAQLLQSLLEGDNYDVTNREDRRKRLLLEILKEKGLKKLFYYSSQFQVSEATISSDLEALEGWLASQNLTVTRKPGSGIAVLGSEDSYRRAISTFISENMDTQMIHDFYENDDEQKLGHICGNGIGQVLNEDIIRRVLGCIGKMKDQRMQTLTENSYTGLIMHISIAINRIMQNEMMEQNEGWEKQIPKDDDYHLAQEIVERLKEEFSMEIPEVEAAYICLHIKGSKHQNIQWSKDQNV